MNCYRRAIAADPDWELPVRNLAWVLATSLDTSVRNGAEALRLAASFNWQLDAQDWDILAAAHAECGQYKQAVQAARRAHDLAVADGRSVYAEKINRRLELYRAGQPFRPTDYAENVVTAETNSVRVSGLTTDSHGPRL